MPNNSANNFINRFSRKVRANSKVSLAEIRKAEHVQDQINAARERIAKAIGQAKKEQQNQEGGRRKRRATRKSSRGRSRSSRH